MTKADRDADGKIRVTPPERHLVDLLPPAPASPVEEETRGARLGRVELAGSVLGLMLALILIVFIERVVPAHQEVRAPAVVPPLPAPTRARPSPTRTPTLTPTPTATALPPTPTATPEPPTPQVIYVEVAPPCDPSNPPFVVQLDVYEGTVPLGVARGTSCDSLEAARANAENGASEMRQAHNRGGKP